MQTSHLDGVKCISLISVPIWRAFVEMSGHTNPLRCDEQDRSLCLWRYSDAVFLAGMMHFDAVMDIKQVLLSFEKASKPASIASCIAVLQECRKEKNLVYAGRAHKVIFESNLHRDRTLGSYIVAMFAECGSMVDAQCSFDQLNHHNDYSWTFLLQGYTDCGEPQRALSLLPKLKKELSCPSSHTYVALLKACAKLKCIEGGQEVHAEVAKEGFETVSHVGSLLVDVYVKSGLLADAREVFNELPNRDVVIWSALIAGYADRGLDEEVMNYIGEMRREGVSPNSVTFICGLKGCKSKDLVQKLHLESAKNGFDRDPIVGNTLVDMYARQHALQEARWVFANLQVRCIVSWTALIAGHVAHDACEKALNFFKRMQRERVAPDAYTFACIVKACGNVGVLNMGQNLHALIVIAGFQDEAYVANALVEMYGKFGLLLEAWDVFYKLPCQDVILWSALLAGHALSGDTAVVFGLFTKMVRKGVQPDRVVFLSVLTACTHAGLVETGGLCFQLMRRTYGVSQAIEHHNCLVDLVARAGQLHEAVAMLDVVPVQPNIVTWVILLCACRNQGNKELGQSALEYALQLHKKHVGSLLVAKQLVWWGGNNGNGGA